MNTMTIAMNMIICTSLPRNLKTYINTRTGQHNPLKLMEAIASGKQTLCELHRVWHIFKIMISAIALVDSYSLILSHYYAIGKNERCM